MDTFTQKNNAESSERFWKALRDPQPQVTYLGPVWFYNHSDRHVGSTVPCSLRSGFWSSCQLCWLAMDARYQRLEAQRWADDGGCDV